MLVRLGIGAHQAEDPVGAVRLRRPGLLSVHQVLVAAQLGGGAQVREVRARARLRIALAPHLLRAQHRAQEALLLRLAAVVDDRGPAQADAQAVGRGRRAQEHELFLEQRVLDVAAALPAVLLRPGHADVAGVVQLLVPAADPVEGRVLGLELVALVVLPPGRQVGFDPGARLVAIGDLRVREPKIHGRLPACHCTSGRSGNGSGSVRTGCRSPRRVRSVHRTQQKESTMETFRRIGALGYGAACC